MIVLGIETSCDETAASVVKDGKEILSNVVSSQIDLHSQFGGVVPELACRRHIDLIMPVIDEALKEAGISLDQVDLIAAAQGPGLVGALLIGLTSAKALALALQKPFVGINHVEAHLYAPMMSEDKQINFPTIGLVASGGHTNLLLIKGIGDYQSIGKTVDDAIGEAFDKTAKLIGLPYPGGPEIEKIAKIGDSSRFPLHAGKVKESPFDFSFSGLKTAVLYTLQKQEKPYSEQLKADIAASFQKAAFYDLIKKTRLACETFSAKTILFGGGVTNSMTLRSLFEKQTGETIELIWPAPGLSLDNAAMIAGLAYHRYKLTNTSDPFDLEPKTRISF